MKKIILIGALMAVGMCCFLASCSSKAQDANGSKGDKGAAVPVTVATVGMKAMPIEITTFGVVQAQSSVQIKAEVGGNLTRVHFRKGQNIQAGDLLFTIDPRSYRAALDQAKANLVRDRALEENALLNAERSKELLSKGFISRSDNDKAQTDAKALSAVRRADEAVVINAKLQVEHCSIRSPISGKAGDLLVSEGTLIKANDVPLVTINQIHPIEVFFSIPQADLPSVRTYMAHKKLKVRASLPKDYRTPEEGDLFFIDNAINQSTGTVKLGALFQNTRESLWPGLSVNVTLVLAIQNDAVVVPTVALQAGREGKFVFVVNPDNTVAVRPVTVQMAASKETVIEKGLQVGERIVTDGQLRLVPGTKVEIKAEVKENSGSPGGRS
jgi:membrane fusion protein, multidrug efflux system